MNDICPEEKMLARQIVAEISHGRVPQSIQRLRELQDALYAAIPDKKRSSRGITWVIQRISELLAQHCASRTAIQDLALEIYTCLDKADRLLGAAIYLMAEYGKWHPAEVLPFFAEAAGSTNWEVREFAAGAFRMVLNADKELVHTWLQEMTRSDNPSQRRFVSETLRPVASAQWLHQEPEYSLSLLRLMFKERHPYPRTSVGNNLSDLARRNPEMVLGIVQELVESGDENSSWIAYRACRNLVKKCPERVMDLLGVNEYHYKDRHFRRAA
jgi:3-methyladenine DNA glycosylase AlkC